MLGCLDPLVFCLHSSALIRRDDLADFSYWMLNPDLSGKERANPGPRLLQVDVADEALWKKSHVEVRWKKRWDDTRAGALIRAETGKLCGDPFQSMGPLFLFLLGDLQLRCMFLGAPGTKGCYETYTKCSETYSEYRCQNLCLYVWLHSLPCCFFFLFPFLFFILTSIILSLSLLLLFLSHPFFHV